MPRQGLDSHEESALVAGRATDGSDLQAMGSLRASLDCLAKMLLPRRHSLRLLKREYLGRPTVQPVGLLNQKNGRRKCWFAVIRAPCSIPAVPPSQLWRSIASAYYMRPPAHRQRHHPWPGPDLSGQNLCFSHETNQTRGRVPLDVAPSVHAPRPARLPHIDAWMHSSSSRIQPA